MGFWEKVKKVLIAPDGAYATNKAAQKIATLFDKKDFDSALDKSTEFIEKYPQYFNGYYYKGYILFNQQKYSESIEYLSKALDLNPTITNLYYLCSYAETELKNYQIALSYIERALIIFPNDVGLLEVKGLALLYLDEVDDANRAFAKAYKIGKSDGLNNTILYFFVHNRFEENLKYIEEAKLLDYNIRGRLILNYLEAMNSCMLGKNYSGNYEVVKKLSKKIKFFGWEFLWIDKWLKTEIIDEKQRRFIEEINNLLKDVRDKLKEY